MFAFSYRFNSFSIVLPLAVLSWHLAAPPKSFCDGTAVIEPQTDAIVLMVKRDLSEVLKRGKDLVDTQADYNDCYRLYEGSLIAVRPFLVSEMDAKTQLALGKARTVPEAAARALALQLALEDILIHPSPFLFPKDHQQIPRKKRDSLVLSRFTLDNDPLGQFLHSVETAEIFGTILLNKGTFTLSLGGKNVVVTTKSETRAMVYLRASAEKGQENNKTGKAVLWIAPRIERASILFSQPVLVKPFQGVPFNLNGVLFSEESLIIDAHLALISLFGDGVLRGLLPKQGVIEKQPLVKKVELKIAVLTLNSSVPIALSNASVLLGKNSSLHIMDLSVLRKDDDQIAWVFNKDCILSVKDAKLNSGPVGLRMKSGSCSIRVLSKKLNLSGSLRTVDVEGDIFSSRIVSADLVIYKTGLVNGRFSGTLDKIPGYLGALLKDGRFEVGSMMINIGAKQPSCYFSAIRLSIPKNQFLEGTKQAVPMSVSLRDNKLGNHLIYRDVQFNRVAIRNLKPPSLVNQVRLEAALKRALGVNQVGLEAALERAREAKASLKELAAQLNLDSAGFTFKLAPEIVFDLNALYEHVEVKSEVRTIGRILGREIKQAVPVVYRQWKPRGAAPVSIKLEIGGKARLNAIGGPSLADKRIRLEMSYEEVRVTSVEVQKGDALMALARDLLAVGGAIKNEGWNVAIRNALPKTIDIDPFAGVSPDAMRWIKRIRIDDVFIGCGKDNVEVFCAGSLFGTVSREICGPSMPIKSVETQSPNGKFFARSGAFEGADSSATIAIYPVNQDQAINICHHGDSVKQVSIVTALAFSPNSTELASGAVDGSVAVWPINPFIFRPDPRRYFAGPKGALIVHRLSFAKDGTRLFVLYRDKTTAEFDLENPK